MSDLIPRIRVWFTHAYDSRNARHRGRRGRAYIAPTIAQPPRPNPITGPIPLIQANSRLATRQEAA
ncbi:hypothetical protein ABZ234_03325 [Nocardiopsis sp. NPDC006198]|uniref:hypothetical protein n=1 Tax=Nocardiopsis sp. NPDC006198 TaxID=3154472 RepID=UPI0033AD313B